MNGLKKTLSIMLCVAMIASGSFMAFAEGESNPQNVTVVEGENAGENVGGEEGGNEGNEGENVDENKEENKDEDKQQSEALLAAIGALNSLPLFDSLTEDTDADALLAQVQAARAAYDALTEEEKLLVEEAKLNNLLDLEFFFENRPSNTPADAPVDQVVATQTETETADLTGEGTQASPYEIKSVDDFNSALEKGTDDIYVKLVENITGTITVESGKSVVLDLNGKTLNGEQTKATATITNYGTLTITGNGTVKREDTKENTGTSSYYVIDNQGIMTIQGGTVTNNSGNGKGGASLIRNGGVSGNTPVLNIEGGTFEQENFIVIKNDDYGTLNISGGTINSTNSQAVQNWATANISNGTMNGDVYSWAYPTSQAETNITGGTIRGDVASISYEGNSKSNVKISGNTVVTGVVEAGTFSDGKVLENPEKSNLEISGGNYGNSIKKDYLNDSLKAGLYSPSANPDAPYSYYTSVEEAKAAAKDDPNAIVTDVETGKEEALYPAAKIGNETYNTLEEALKAAKSGDTIVLQKDVSTGAVTLRAGVILDGGNHVITCNTEIANGAFITATGDNVTIKNATVNVDGKAKHGIQFYKVKGGKLENVNVMGGKYTAVIVNGAEVSINGGNLSTNGYAVVEYAMGNGVTEVPKLTMNNVTTPNTDKPLVYMDKATIDRIKENTKELGQGATEQQVLEHLKKDKLTGNNIKDMQVGENGMIIVPAPSTPVAPPVVPEKPNSNSGSTGSSSTVQQMEEREKPDPADKKAMEEYNFWMQVKSKIRATAEGKTLRITVKEGIEYMPASVMQTLYECKVGITLYWDGVTIEIPVGKAQPKQALRVYWTKTKLMDLYNA